MDFSRPPQCWEELQVWKVFVRVCEADVWQITERWIRKFGNPYVIPEGEDEDRYVLRHLFQQALQFCINK